MKHKKIGRLVVFALVVFIAAGLFSGPVKRAYVLPVLMYHRVDGQQSLVSKLAVSPRAFERQMRFFSRHRYNVISLKNAVGLLKDGEKIPAKTVVITFDDGYEDNYSTAFPILKKYNIPATIFVIVDFIGHKGYLNEQELRELAAHPLITIASHTLSHRVLTELSPRERKDEIYRSGRLLEKKIGRSVELFSYPLGAFDPAARRMVISAGYLGAVATNPGKDYPRHDIYALKRLRISENCGNMFVFWAETSGYYTFIKEHRDD
ncbi:MAG: polysaccharide deacetylase family protein [Candidatus Omnitrophota bacterium]